MGKLTAGVTAITGALTAIGVFVVIPGSAAMLVRLDRADLPPDLGVVTTLPDQFLLAFGLGYIVLPLLILVALSLAVTWLPGAKGKQSGALESWAEWAGWIWSWLRSTKADSPDGRPQHPPKARSWLLAAFAVLIALLLPVAVFAFWPPDWWLWYLASFATAIVFVAGCVLVGKFSGGGDLAFGWLVLVASLVFVGWTIAFAGVRAEFPQVTLCLKTDDGRLDGVLIGRTDDSYYVGEPEHRVALLGLEPTEEELDLADAGDSAQIGENQRATQVRANITGGLRAAGYGVIDVADPGNVTFQRTALVIADSRDPAERLDLPLELGLPVLVIDASDGFAEGALPIREQDARRPSVLAARVKTLLDRELEEQERRDERRDLDDELDGAELDRPQRRIAAVSAADVGGYRLGASGPCPVND